MNGYFYFFFYLLDLSCGECNVVFYVLLCLSRVSELFGETICNMIGCSC